MIDIKRAELIDVLKNDVPQITFTKKDGTERVMNCTLRDDLLPTQVVKEGVKERKVNEEIVPVYDVDIKSWRSIRLDSIKEIHPGTSDNG